jgi:hypothetical protein
MGLCKCDKDLKISITIKVVIFVISFSGNSLQNKPYLKPTQVDCVEYTKAFKITALKELGKLAL